LVVVGDGFVGQFHGHARHLDAHPSRDR
jgi:hypothetical protein